MNNKDDYKKSIEQIHASEELKEKTIEKIKNNSKNKVSIPWRMVLATCTTLLIIFTASIIYIKSPQNQNNIQENQHTQEIAKVKNDLPRFENINQLKEVLEKNSKDELYNSTLKSESEAINDSTSTTETAAGETTSENYSKTNVQTENVDEADIIKTDGEYIYYVTNGKIYIINAKELKIVSKIEYNENSKELFYPSEIYINKEKIIVLGNYSEYSQDTINRKIGNVNSDMVYTNQKRLAKAIVYDISSKEEPKIIREVGIEGSYMDSRMIDDNVYFISTKYANYYKNLDDELLPIYKDTAKSDEEIKIPATDIAYFEDTKSSSYMLVAAFNINNDEEISTETFLGANEIVYASEKNLYVTQTIYENSIISTSDKSIIYKFNLSDGQIKLQCKAEVNGDLNNQFSMDEYEGNLRIATTQNKYGNSKNKTSNQLYVLDENLKQIGKIEDIATGEKIYSVRFIGKVGYVVTFKQIDPLFVIDLSNPNEPKIKGELKIPGYSSYLHPYDETHIIGIGYNTKSNGYGGITNSNMKMSMFDVSNLENPKEIFNIGIGEIGKYSYTSSEITSNHKLLFYNKNKNLIGFPITYRGKEVSDDKNGFVIFKIDLEKGFEKYGEVLQDIDYRTNIDRMIYIEDTLYTLSEQYLISYNLNTMEKISELNLN